MKTNRISGQILGRYRALHAEAALLLLLFTFTTQAWSQQASISPSSLNFPAQLIGGFGSTPKPQSVTLTNTGSTSLTVKSIFVGDNFNNTTVHDYVQTNNCPKTLSPGASCVVKVTFAPLHWARSAVHSPLRTMIRLVCR
jgi:hypothetical protein